MKRPNRVKVALSSIFFLFLILLPVKSWWDVSVIPPEPYWRYQGMLISKSIVQQGAIPQGDQFVSSSFLFSWVQSFVSEFMAPLWVAMLSIVLDTPPPVINFMPLFAMLLVTFQAFLVYELTAKVRTLPVTVLLGIAGMYITPNILTMPHRATLGWTLFFLTIGMILKSRKDPRATYALWIVLPVYLLSFKTLAIASILFVGILTISSRIGTIEPVPMRVWTILAVSGTAVYVLMYNWLGYVARKTFLITSGLIRQGNIQLSIINQVSGITPDIISPYLLDPSIPNYLQGVIWTTRIVSVFILLGYLIHRLNRLYRAGQSVWDISHTWEIEDAILVALVSQGLGSIVLLPIFASSGGTNPLIIATYFVPVLGTMFLFKLAESPSSIVLDVFRSHPGHNHYLSVKFIMANMLVIFFISGMTASVAIPYESTGAEINSIDTTDQLHLTWVSSHATAQRKAGDFQTLSAYYAIGGWGPTYIPPPGAPAYTSNNTVNHLIDVYYRRPQGAPVEHYIASRNMMTDGMTHISGLVTEPNPSLNEQLSHNASWSKVYTNGNGASFTNST